MNYIVFDLEFNQDFNSLQDFDNKRTKYPFEIIQIGAVKLDPEFNSITTFNRYVKPTIYKNVNQFITELTGISTQQLMEEETFPAVYKAYSDFIGETGSVFCIWGMSDIKELFNNAENHKLDSKRLPRMYINLQPIASRYLSLPAKNQLRLQQAVEELKLPLTYEFHNALNDAYYTAEIFKKVYSSDIKPILYDPAAKPVRTRQKKREIDLDKLIGQFEKMYSREMTDEEKGMIVLAYKMGKTNQFLK